MAREPSPYVLWQGSNPRGDEAAAAVAGYLDVFEGHGPLLEWLQHLLLQPLLHVLACLRDAVHGNSGPDYPWLFNGNRTALLVLLIGPR